MDGNLTKQEVEKQNQFIKDNKFSISFASVGFASGIAFSVINKTGFWKGVGYTLLFNFAGGALGKAVDSLKK